MDTKDGWKLSRRQLLLGTGSLALASLFAPKLIMAAMAKAGVVYAPGSGKWVGTTCNGCTSFCAKQVYIQDGRALHIRGNEYSKVHGTASCPRQYLALQELYDPDRVRTPMLRGNPEKGRGIDPQFKSISWEEAIKLMADQFMALREQNETHRYVALRGRYSYLSDLLIKNFTQVMGSPNAITHSALCAEADKLGSFFTEGNWGYRQYDIKDTRYILSFGVDPLSSNRQVSYYCKEWGNTLDRAQVAIVDPRFSASAAKADEWLPVVPGQDAALGLALAHQVMVNGGWHRPFVGDFVDGKNRFIAGSEVEPDSFKEQHTLGLVEWWNLELKDRTPEWAAELCGIKAEQIRRIAVKLADAAPKVQIWRSRGAQMQHRGGYTAIALHALNGLLGSIDQEGGVLKWASVPLGKMPSSKKYVDEVGSHGLKMEKIDRRGRLEYPALKKGKSGGGVVTAAVAESILSEDPYLPEFVLGYFNNFTFSAPGGQQWEKALKKVSFVTHLTTNISEFSYYADLILPAPHFMFERWGIQKTAGNRYTQVSISQPAVKRLGMSVEDECGLPWLLAEELAKRGFENPLNYLKTEFKDPETGREPTSADEVALYATKILTQTFWDPAKYKEGDHLSGWQEFMEKGIWNSKPYAFRKRWSHMKTKSKKFEFYSETLKYALQKHAKKHHTDVDGVMQATGYLARGELAFIPHYETPYRFGDESKFPMLFVDYKSRLNREGRSANTAWYQYNLDIDPGSHKLADAAKLNPLDAQKLGISDGDTIRITSLQGSITCQAALFEGVRPGTVAKAFGQGHWAYGRTASQQFGKTPFGGNNNELLPPVYEQLSGSSAFYGQIGVRVEKV
ncbi:molybdopterin-dependent oxidoreductase [Psychromonas aquimarina]|uniref:molybdopterin-dependent oxidoreductase n=1 Tax=Psychromonas aquimarina TaxID=444919 RepID=UPI0004009D91|nr:molybdopterin-dependent oxidoreductase [Psychromonas aquimarina]